MLPGLLSASGGLSASTNSASGDATGRAAGSTGDFNFKAATGALSSAGGALPAWLPLVGVGLLALWILTNRRR